MNTIPSAVVTDERGLAVRLPGGVVPLPPDIARAIERAAPPAVIIGVRPEHLEIDERGGVAATVTVVESLGHERHVICRLEDSTMIIVRQAADMTSPKEGERVHLAAAPEHIHVFDVSTERRIGAEAP